MYQNISIGEAAHQLRADDNAKWTSEAAYELAFYYNELSDMTDCGPFNVVDIRCEWSEYTPAELVRQYGRAYGNFVDTLTSVMYSTQTIQLGNGNTLVIDF